MDINQVAAVLWFVFIHLASVYSLFYVSLQSFMSIEQIVKKFTFISYFLFSCNSCNRCASSPFATELPDAPDLSPITTVQLCRGND